MLSSIQIKVLQHLLANCEEYIVDLAVQNGIKNTDATLGVANFLASHPDNFIKMSPNQKFHYTSAIEPLINEVCCDGMTGEEGSCVGNGFIDEDSLLGAYLGEDMRCQHCVSTADSWFENNP